MNRERWIQIRNVLGTDLVTPSAEHGTHVAMLDEIEEAIFSHDNCVVQDWVLSMPLKMQAVLLMSLRGPDTHRAPGIKKMTRWLRGLTFVPGDPKNVVEFMLVDLPPRLKEKNDTHRELEFASQHFYSHLMHGLEVVGYRHPDGIIRAWALDLYKDMCDLFHLNYETFEQHEHRLRHLEWPTGAQPRNAEEAFFLVKNHGELSKRDQEMLAARVQCSRCGGTNTNGDMQTCQHCGALWH